MHLRNVELFCEVAQRRSFSKAADAQCVSQSSASQAVHHLEEQLGTLLIDRSVRPLGLTPAGQLFYEGCRKLLDQFRILEDRVRRLSDAVVGRVRVAAIYSVGLLQMDAYVRRFRELYPKAELQLAYLHPDEVYQRVLDDEADLGLVSFPKDGGDISSIAWQEQPMVLVVPASHRLAACRSVTSAALNGEDFIGFTPELTIRRRIDRWLKSARISVRMTHSFDNIENIKRAVEIGTGVALLPEPTVRREAEMGTLCPLPLTDVNWVRPLGIIHRRHKTLTSVADKFVELLHEDPATFSRSGGNGTGRIDGGAKHPPENGRTKRTSSRKRPTRPATMTR